ncbi:hypothetical protein evm_000021 [Chilo suppressalis]|nr:hypothetical protein evm_000021 [Chilo suppressalis]
MEQITQDDSCIEMLCLTKTWITKKKRDLLRLDGFEVASSFYRKHHDGGEATRTTTKTSTCLDLLFTNFRDIITSAVIDMGLSDHKAVTAILDLKINLMKGKAENRSQYVEKEHYDYEKGLITNVRSKKAEIALATENSIILQNLDFAASGSYSCEVSMDTPIYTKESSEKQLTVFHPQKHHPRIDFPTHYLSFGETLRANCTTAPALPAPHITWFINGKKMDELAAHSHKFRVPMSERNGRRGLQRRFEYEIGVSSPPPLLALTHASHIATRPPGCSLKDHDLSEIHEHEEPNSVHSSSRHRSRRPSRGRDLYVTVSELHLIATGRMEISCVSTIPEFRNKEDKFADVRNDTVIGLVWVTMIMNMQVNYDWLGLGWVTVIINNMQVVYD